jgi:hypothetical protein
MGQRGGSVTVHSFATSDGHEKDSWWASFYRNAFPRYRTHEHNADVRSQKRGVDHRVHLSGDITVIIDCKTRSEKWPDVLLEVYSDYENGVKGWALKPQDTMYVAYVFMTEATGWLIPFQLMQRALLRHRDEWKNWAENRTHGFRWVDACNRSADGTTYTTRSLAVPYAVLVQAMAEPIPFEISMEDRLGAA